MSCWLVSPLVGAKLGGGGVECVREGFCYMLGGFSSVLVYCQNVLHELVDVQVL